MEVPQEPLLDQFGKPDWGIETALDQTDKKLYLAKNQGRNKFIQHYEP